MWWTVPRMAPPIASRPARLDEHVALIVVPEHRLPRRLVETILVLAPRQRPVDVRPLPREALSPGVDGEQEDAAARVDPRLVVGLDRAVQPPRRHAQHALPRKKALVQRDTPVGRGVGERAVQEL